MRSYTKAFKSFMLQQVNQGADRERLCSEYDVPRTTLSNWISQEYNLKHDRAPKPRVAEIRKALEMHDTGEIHLSDVIRLSGRPAATVIQWIEEPKFREATFEFDPTMDYDYNDLIDRSVVAHHLCTQVDTPLERFEILQALTNPTEVLA